MSDKRKNDFAIVLGSIRINGFTLQWPIFYLKFKIDIENINFNVYNIFTI